MQPAEADGREGFPDETARASVRVLEGAVELVKAEIALGISKVRARTERIVVGAAFLLAAFMSAQVSIALICVSPVLFAECDPRFVALALVLAVGATTSLATVGALRLKSAVSVEKG